MAAMERQMKAQSREKRESILLAEGEKQSKILIAEGEKDIRDTPRRTQCANRKSAKRRARRKRYAPCSRPSRTE